MLETQKKAIIIGATSGIGRSLATLLARNNYQVGVTGRREALLRESGLEYQQMDVTDTTDALRKLEALVALLGGLDLLVFSSGTGDINQTLDFEIEKRAIDVNVTGFTAIVDWAYRYFDRQGNGHLVAISSIAGLRGGADAPAYNATKSYQINYLESLRLKASKTRNSICITDVRPGFVDTAMAKGEGLFWVLPVEEAVRQIYRAIYRKKKVLYISKRWGFLAFLLKRLPFAILKNV